MDVPPDADHALRVGDLDVAWAAEVVAFCEQQIPLNRLEDGQVAAAMRGDLLFDLGCLRYGLGAPLDAVRACLHDSAIAVWAVFEQDATIRGESGQPDRSLANPARGRAGMQRALVAGDRALAARLATVQSDAGEPAPARALGEALRAGRAARFLDALADYLVAHQLYGQRPEYRHRPDRLLAVPALAYSVEAVDRGLLSRDSLPPDDAFLPLGLASFSEG